MRIRLEEPADASAVRAVNQAAFETPVEANIVDALRGTSDCLASLVAEADEGGVVGHILFSRVRLAGQPDILVAGLGPMAVSPKHQRHGIGSGLVRAGLERCRNMGCSAVVVLGHPNYYPRFGFVPASRFEIDSEYDVPDEAFMLIELQPQALRGVSGAVSYNEAFAEA